jgi:tetratricopeptide (TPR) repeat protein
MARRRANADPVAHVRVIRAPEDLRGDRYRLLDTVEAKLGPGTSDFRTKVDLRMAAAERGANAIVILDSVGSGKQARRRALAIRLAEPLADARALCVDGRDGVADAPRLAACERHVWVDSMDAVAWRALAARRHSLWDDAGEHAALEHVVALVPHDATAWYALGRATKGRGKRDDKLAAWRRAAALDTTYVAPRLALGIALAEDRRHAAAALPWLDEAVRLGGRGEPLYWKGRALLKLERWQEAHDAFIAAADSGGMKPTWAYGGAAYALSRAGRHAEAVAMWDRVLTLDSSWFYFATREFNMIGDEKSAWKRSRKAVGR